MHSAPLIDDDENVDRFYRAVQQGSPFLFPSDSPRQMLELMYQKCSDVLDKKFKSQLKADFPASFAELYFAATVRLRYKYQIEHLGDRGPDFYLPDCSLHCEITSVKVGDSLLNSIPIPVEDEVYQYPEREVILRLTSAIDTKFKKIKKYIDDDLISDEASVLLVVSANGIEERFPMYPEGGYPQIVKAVLPVGDQTFWIDVNSGKRSSVTYQWRDSVIKHQRGGVKNIETNLFLRDDSCFISAIVYSYATAFDSREFSEFGDDFLIVHNPMAKKPIPVDFFKSGIQFFAEVLDGGVKLSQYGST